MPYGWNLRSNFQFRVWHQKAVRFKRTAKVPSHTAVLCFDSQAVHLAMLVCLIYFVVQNCKNFTKNSIFDDLITFTCCLHLVSYFGYTFYAVVFAFCGPIEFILSSNQNVPTRIFSLGYSYFSPPSTLITSFLFSRITCLYIIG